MKIINHSELTPELAAAGCLVLDMSNEDYHAYDGLSCSGFKTFYFESPADYAYAEPTERTRPMAIGEALHKAALEPDLFATNYMLLEDVKDRRASEYKQAAKEYGGDFTLVSHEARWVKNMTTAARLNPDMVKYLDADGYTEASMFATCPTTGVLIKCRFDKLCTGEVDIPFDLKKTQSVKYRDLQNTIARYGYHVQDAFYRYVYKCCTGKELDPMRFGFVKEKPAHASKVQRIDSEAEMISSGILEKGLEQYAECLRTNEWPYPDGSEELISLPMWAVSEELDDSELEEVIA